MPVDPVRDAAIDVLLRVFERGAYLNLALDRTLTRKTNLSERGRRFLTQIVYGTVRHKLLLDHILQPRLHQPLADLPAAIQIILRMGVYQTLFLSGVTFPAMVHTSVDLAKKRGHAGTARLVNAVLKRTPKSMEEVDLPDSGNAIDAFLSIRYSVPAFLVQRWIADHGPIRAEAICRAIAEEAPRTIRTNTHRLSRDELRTVLNSAGIPSQKHPHIPEALILDEKSALMRSQAFKQGYFLIQDGASMLPPHALQPKRGERVLDMCAAPGGKSTHLVQLMHGEGQVVAMDQHAHRLPLIADNRERLRIPGILDLVAGDGTRPPFTQPFDRVLVDAPCTGYGTLRRHPDIKWRTRPEEAAELAEIQRALLRSAIGLCENGGVIVYSVCTFTPEETTGVVDSVVKEGAVELENAPDWMNPWKLSKGQYLILPDAGPLDGYFWTRLRKRS